MKVQDTSRELPCDIEIEQALIGSVLLDNSELEKAVNLLEPEAFSDPLHQRIFDAICYLVREEPGPVSPITLNSAMAGDPGLAQVGGGKAYLTSLARAAPALPNTEVYARILNDLLTRRRLVIAGENLINAAFDAPPDQPVVDIIDTASSEIEAAAADTAHRSRRHAARAGDAANRLFQKIEDQAKAEKPIGISTGFTKLDRVLGGLYPGKLIFIGGRPGMGKSQLATNIAKNVATRLMQGGWSGYGVPVDYLSGEMDEDELSARLCTDIDFEFAQRNRLKPLKYGDFVQLRATPGDWERLVPAQQVLAGLELDLFDVPRLTLEWIKSNSRRRARRNPGHRIVIVDHLQLVTVEDLPRGANRLTEQTIITKELKELAKELGWTFIVLSQLSRGVEEREDKHPQESDLREGGSIEQDADVVILLYRAKKYAQDKIRRARNEEQRVSAIAEYDRSRNVLEAMISKNRSGATADWFELFIDEKASALRDERPDYIDPQDMLF